MLGIYLSGTGNTRYCMKKLIFQTDKEAECVALEDDGIIQKIKAHTTIYIGYPVQFSNIPFMLRDFIIENKDLWQGKQIFCVATMGAFSGDGAGCAARLLRKYGATILGGLHIRMPDSVCDSKLLKKSDDQNLEIIARADEKIQRVGIEIQSGNYPQEGISFFSHLCGLFGQRLWFYNKTRRYTDKLKIQSNCIGCGKCERVCPMKNIGISGGKAVAGERCTMCYRCISECPQKAITLLGDEIVEQYSLKKYRPD